MSTYEHRLSLAAGPLGAKQYDFITNELFREMAMLGPFNTGKSTALVDWLVISGLTYPGANLVLTRAKLSDLRRTTLTKYLARTGKFISEEFNKNDAVITFPEIRGARSKLYMFGLDRTDLVEVLKSFDIFRVGVEESNECPPKSLDLLLGRARQDVRHVSRTWREHITDMAKRWAVSFDRARTAIGVTPQQLDERMVGLNQMKHVFNPEGNDFTWKRVVNLPYPDKDEMGPEWTQRNVHVREFALNSKQLGRYKLKGGNLVQLPTGERAYVHHESGPMMDIDDAGDPIEAGRSVELMDGRRVSRDDCLYIGHKGAIFVWPEENESRNIDADEGFLHMMDSTIRERYYEAKVDSREGLLFPGFSRDVHVVRHPEGGLPRDVRGVGAVDHGLRHPTVALWGIETLTPRNGFLILREYSVAGLSAVENAYAIKGMPDRSVKDTTWMGDPSMGRTEATSMQSVKEQYFDSGLPLIDADNDVDATIDAVREMLVRERNWRTGVDLPRLFISDKCEQLISSLEMVTLNDMRNRRDQWAVDFVDALRYLVNGINRLPTYGEDSPVMRPQVKTWDYAPLGKRTAHTYR